LKKQGYAPDVIVTDKLRSYGAAKAQIGLSARHEQGLGKNNRAENSHQPKSLHSDGWFVTNVTSSAGVET
jgi:transposase-like protein